MKYGLALTLLSLLLTGCKHSPDSVNVEFTFENEATGWVADFADYRVDQGEEFYELEWGFETLPEPLEDLQGLKVSGSNHSDDLFMFVKKQFIELKPETTYELQFEITFATNAPSGCFGIGGAPGEAVYVKAGATDREPKPITIDGTYRMNIDKGNQASGGSDATVIGDFANSQRCEDGTVSPYELKTLTNEGDAFTATTDENGNLWVLFGTDSGFEGKTTIYYVDGVITATRV